MNRVERRVRSLINPYSTAFAMWWCHSGRYLGLVQMVSGDQASARPRPAMPPVPPSPDLRLAAQALRRAAIDEVLDDGRQKDTLRVV
jgi:hypothetical protein